MHVLEHMRVFLTWLSTVVAQREWLAKTAAIDLIAAGATAPRLHRDCQFLIDHHYQSTVTSPVAFHAALPSSRHVEAHFPEAQLRHSASSCVPMVAMSITTPLARLFGIYALLGSDSLGAFYV